MMIMISIFLMIQALQPATVKIYESQSDRTKRQVREYVDEVDRTLAKQSDTAKRSKQVRTRVRPVIANQSIAQDLERLANLKKRGLLTNSEFNTAKAKVLRQQIIATYKTYVDFS